MLPRAMRNAGNSFTINVATLATTWTPTAPGPASHYVYGRRAASGADFEYSDALKNSGIGWDDKTLDQWLTNPAAMAPGQKMYFMTNAPQDRADIIAFLKEASMH